MAIAFGDDLVRRIGRGIIVEAGPRGLSVRITACRGVYRTMTVQNRLRLGGKRFVDPRAQQGTAPADTLRIDME